MLKPCLSCRMAGGRAINKSRQWLKCYISPQPRACKWSWVGWGCSKVARCFATFCCMGGAIWAVLLPLLMLAATLVLGIGVGSNIGVDIGLCAMGCALAQLKWSRTPQSKRPSVWGAHWQQCCYPNNNDTKSELHCHPPSACQIVSL